MVRYTVPRTTFYLEAARGNLKTPDQQSVYTVNKFGKNADIDAGGGVAFEDIISIGGTLDLTQLDSTATTVSIVSGSTNDDEGGSGAEKVRLYGLDANYDLQDAEFTLNGQTPVVTTGYNWRFIYRAKVTQSNNGANDAYNDGIITFSKTGGNNIMQIDAGTNQTLHSAYMIPRNYKGYMVEYWMDYENAPATDEATIRLQSKEFGFPWTIKEEHILLDGRSYIRDFEKAPLEIPEKAIVKLSADVGQDNTVWTGGFDLVVLPNDYIFG
jgi:hypothetical protein